jgi:hypothetical protein
MVETAAVLHQVSKVTFCMTSLRSQFAPKLLRSRVCKPVQAFKQVCGHVEHKSIALL